MSLLSCRGARRSVSCTSGAAVRPVPSPAAPGGRVPQLLLILAVVLALSPARAAAEAEAEAEEAFSCGHRHHAAALEGAAAAAYGAGIGSRAFDPLRGLDVFNYAPDRTVDLLHLDLEVDLTRLLERRWSGVARYSFTAFAGADQLLLDAVGVEIAEVLVATGDAGEAEGTVPRWDHDGERLTIVFDAPLAAGTPGSVTIRWTGAEPRKGLYFILPAPEYPGRPTQVWTQGQTNTNSHWFPTFDAPNERFSSSTAVRVPAGMSAISNGERRADDSGRFAADAWLAAQAAPAAAAPARFAFHQAIDHPAYLVSLVAGDLVVLREEWNGIPLEACVWKGREEDARVTFRNTGAMLDLFARWTGHPYPYAKYAQSVVFNFIAGGMENITATTLYEDAIIDRRLLLERDMDGLIAHEIAHQWFGDWITCRTWQHIWLNEGFATYLEVLWREELEGEDGLHERLWDNLGRFADADDPASGAALLYPDYADNWEVFGHKGSVSYNKGAWVLHALRRAVGDDMFRAILGEYIRRHAQRAVETDDLRRVVEDLTGADWEWFFTQWVVRPGTPRLDMGYEWDEASRVATLSVEQKQTISRERPAFRLPLRVAFRLADGSLRVEEVEMVERKATFAWQFDAAPEVVAPNFDAGTLAKITWSAPAKMLRAAALGGPTLYARLMAVESLAAGAGRAGREALAEVLAEEGVPSRVRAEAARALGRFPEEESRDVLLAWLAAEEARLGRERPAADALAAPGEVAAARVRIALLEALGERGGPRVVEAFRASAARILGGGEPAYGAEVAVARALVRHDFTASWPTIEAMLTRPSWNDRLRRGVVEELRGVADVRAPEFARAQEFAASLAAPGAPYRTRPEAIATLGVLGSKLPRHERDAWVPRLAPLTEDPVANAQRAAIGALGTLDAPLARGVLDRLAASTDDEVAEAARGARAVLDRAGPAAEEVAGLRRELQLLREERAAFVERLERLELLLDPGAGTESGATEDGEPATTGGE